MIGTNLGAPTLKLDRFEEEGLKAKCRVKDCKGIVMIRRDHQTFHLDSGNIYCALCGQRYSIHTGGPSRLALRRKAST